MYAYIYSPVIRENYEVKVEISSVGRKKQSADGEVASHFATCDMRFPTAETKTMHF